MAQETILSTEVIYVKMEVDGLKQVKTEPTQKIKQENDLIGKTIPVKKEVKNEPGNSCQNSYLAETEKIFCKRLEDDLESESESDDQKSESNEIDETEIEKLLVKEEVENECDENFELSQSDIEKEFEAFNKEDEKTNSGKTTLENNTTAYKCQMCDQIFIKFPEYKAHKKLHFIEKRR